MASDATAGVRRRYRSCTAACAGLSTMSLFEPPLGDAEFHAIASALLSRIEGRWISGCRTALSSTSTRTMHRRPARTGLSERQQIVINTQPPLQSSGWRRVWAATTTGSRSTGAGSTRATALKLGRAVPPASETAGPVARRTASDRAAGRRRAALTGRTFPRNGSAAILGLTTGQRLNRSDARCGLVFGGAGRPSGPLPRCRASRPRHAVRVLGNDHSPPTFVRPRAGAVPGRQFLQRVRHQVDQIGGDSPPPVSRSPSLRVCRNHPHHHATRFCW